MAANVEFARDLRDRRADTDPEQGRPERHRAIAEREGRLQERVQESREAQVREQAGPGRGNRLDPSSDGGSARSTAHPLRAPPARPTLDQRSIGGECAVEERRWGADQEHDQQGDPKTSGHVPGRERHVERSRHRVDDRRRRRGRCVDRENGDLVGAGLRDKCATRDRVQGHIRATPDAFEVQDRVEPPVRGDVVDERGRSIPERHKDRVAARQQDGARGPAPTGRPAGARRVRVYRRTRRLLEHVAGSDRDRRDAARSVLDDKYGAAGRVGNDRGRAGSRERRADDRRGGCARVDDRNAAPGYACRGRAGVHDISRRIEGEGSNRAREGDRRLDRQVRVQHEHFGSTLDRHEQPPGLGVEHHERRAAWNGDRSEHRRCLCPPVDLRNSAVRS